jgi:hypothetical protein
VVQWLLYKGYKKTRAVKDGYGSLREEGFPYCHFPYKNKK